MLYILNKPSGESIRQLAVIGADDDEKSVLFIADAVFLATEGAIRQFEGLGVDSFYAAEDAVEARVVRPDARVELADYDDMAELLEEADKTVML